MRQNKKSKKGIFMALSHRSRMLLILSLVLVFTAVVGVSVAYLMDLTDPVENVFNPTNVTCEVVEDWTDGDQIKSNVTVKNTSDISAYIRAFWVITWQDDEGNIIAEMPVFGEDYSLSMPSDSGWTQGSDGFYYYKTAVPAGESTDILISECKVLQLNGQYRLHVQIIADAIQGVPDSAVTDAWGVTVGADGSISK